MRATTVWGLILSASVGAQTADKGQALNLKLGLWEVTTTVMSAGEMPIPAGVREKLAPEQRARLEERIKASKADAAKTTIKKQCLTKTQLARRFPFRPDAGSCTWTVLASTNRKVEMRGECVEQGFKREARLRIEAPSEKQAEGSLQFLTNSEISAPATTSTFKAKWVGPLCRTP